MALDERTDPAQIIAKVGLRYRIRLTPRVRTDLADDGGGTLTWRPVLSHAARAEPVLEPGNHIPYRGRT
ncbi:hypothetical protein [Kitasatospora purpeofusca]|uniref:hypothetical protein n=1 Tax=Kitasatospora purpeofusca TaxID=67352 RepID=UPI003F4AB2B5